MPRRRLFMFVQFLTPTLALNAVKHECGSEGKGQGLRKGASTVSVNHFIPTLHRGNDHVRIDIRPHA